MAKNLERLFDEVNRRWFGGKLRRRKVRWSSFAHKHPAQRGLYDVRRRTIYIRRGLPIEDLLPVLLHEMCHIGCHYHGKQFVAKMARLKSMGAPVHEEVEFKPGFYPSREAGRIIADLVPQLTEGMNWSEGRHYVAKALLLSVSDLKRQIPWAQRRWERLQREAAKERKILARLLSVGAVKDRAPSNLARKRLCNFSFTEGRPWSAQSSSALSPPFEIAILSRP
jgi:hypothetical protein